MRHREQMAEKVEVLPLNGLTMNGRKITPALANVKMNGTRTSRSLTSFARMERGRKDDEKSNLCDAGCCTCCDALRILKKKQSPGGKSIME